MKIRRWMRRFVLRIDRLDILKRQGYFKMRLMYSQPKLLAIMLCIVSNQEMFLDPGHPRNLPPLTAV